MILAYFKCRNCGHVQERHPDPEVVKGPNEMMGFMMNAPVIPCGCPNNPEQHHLTVKGKTAGNRLLGMADLIAVEWTP